MDMAIRWSMKLSTVVPVKGRPPFYYKAVGKLFNICTQCAQVRYSGVDPITFFDA